MWHCATRASQTLLTSILSNICPGRARGTNRLVERLSLLQCYTTCQLILFTAIIETGIYNIIDREVASNRR